jgi:hypothetical protein
LEIAARPTVNIGRPICDFLRDSSSESVRALEVQGADYVSLSHKECSNPWQRKKAASDIGPAGLRPCAVVGIVMTEKKRRLYDELKAGFKDLAADREGKIALHKEARIAFSVTDVDKRAVLFRAEYDHVVVALNALLDAGGTDETANWQI